MDERTSLVQANAMHIPLPDESVHCVVTSPPYWTLRDYDLPPLVWDGEPDCAHVWGERVTAGEGYASSSRRRWQHGAKRDDAPDEWRPETGQGKFCRCCGAWRGCLGLEPTPELYVAHLVEVFREVWRVLRADGTLWLNLGDTYAHDTKWGGRSGRKNAGSVAGGYQTCRNARTNSGLKPKDLVGVPWRVAFALQDDGWWLRSDVVWHKPNCMPESVTDRPTKAHEYLFLLSKSARYFYDQDAVREPQTGNAHSRGNGATPKSDAADVGRVRANRSFHCATSGSPVVPGGRNRRTVWTIPTQPYSGAHFATFPPALAEPCIGAGTSERGVCPRCGAPWERVVEVERVRRDSGGHSPKRAGLNEGGEVTSGLVSNRLPVVTTVGWLPSCACYGGSDIPRYPSMPDEAEPPVYCEVCGGVGQVTLWGFMAGQAVNCQACKGRGVVGKPNQVWLDWQVAWEAINRQRVALVSQYADCATARATILDPFVGSGTTSLVARALGRRSVGLDLSFDYLHDQARERLDLRALAEWLDGKQAEAAWEDLPLFRGVG
jgi:DNA modification methylase